MKIEELKIGKDYWIEFIHPTNQDYSYTGVATLLNFTNDEFVGGGLLFKCADGIDASFEPQYVIRERFPSISWQKVLYPHKWFGHISLIQEAAEELRYPYYWWNGAVYETATHEVSDLVVE